MVNIAVAKINLSSARISDADLDWAFPHLDPGIEPFGSKILVQLRCPKVKSKGGILLANDTVETEKWNTQVAKVLALGSLAFHSRNEMKPWPEGAWCKVGDFVRVPKYNGDRWELPIPGRGEGELALFVLFNDTELLGRVADPFKIKAYI